jgi:hypothetical protein
MTMTTAHTQKPEPVLAPLGVKVVRRPQFIARLQQKY